MLSFLLFHCVRRSEIAVVPGKNTASTNTRMKACNLPFLRILLILRILRSAISVCFAIKEKADVTSVIPLRSGNPPAS